MEMAVINKVKGYRNLLNLNQTQMAEALGITLTSYRNKEQGKTAWRDNERIKIKEMLLPYFPNITIDEIFY